MSNEEKESKKIQNISIPGTMCFRCRNSGSIKADHYLECYCPECEKGEKILEEEGSGQF